MADVPAKLRHRIDPAAFWAATNSTLLRGELGIESDTGRLKSGDGVLPWAALPYAGGLDAILSGGRVVLDCGGPGD